MKVTNLELFNMILNQDIRTIKAIKSIVNKNERTPSLKFYYDDRFGDYLFKDFSSGECGGPVKFIMLRDGLSYDDAKNVIKGYIKNYDPQANAVKVEYVIKKKTVTYDIERYTSEDLKYWEKYNITDVNHLYKHMVYPISNIYYNDMFIGKRAIGYFDNDSNLIQIYLPANSVYNTSGEKKFYTLSGSFAIQRYNSKYLIITKSKKEMVVWDNILKGSFDIACWYSESIKLEKKAEFHIFMNHYEKIYLNYDNDKVGQKQMEYYSKFGIIPLFTVNDKNITDVIEKKKSFNFNELNVQL